MTSSVPDYTRLSLVVILVSKEALLSRVHDPLKDNNHIKRIRWACITIGEIILY